MWLTVFCQVPHKFIQAIRLLESFQSNILGKCRRIIFVANFRVYLNFSFIFFEQDGLTRLLDKFAG